MTHMRATGPVLFDDVKALSEAQPPEPRHPGPYVAVALEQGIDRTLEYAIPARLTHLSKVGQRVRVPLGARNRPTFGYTISISDASDYPKIKPILGIDDDRVLVPQQLMELARWMSRYYVTPLGSVLETILPSAVRRKIGMGYTQQVRLKLERSEAQAILERTRERKRRSILASLL